MIPFSYYVKFEQNLSDFVCDTVVSCKLQQYSKWRQQKPFLYNYLKYHSLTKVLNYSIINNLIVAELNLCAKSENSLWWQWPHHDESLWWQWPHSDFHWDNSGSQLMPVILAMMTLMMTMNIKITLMKLFLTVVTVMSGSNCDRNTAMTQQVTLTRRWACWGEEVGVVHLHWAWLWR